MIFQVSAACGCHMGKVRKNNEDNFFFNGRFLPEINDGLNGIVSEKHHLESMLCYGVFDGMGGEEYGEKASFAAVETMEQALEVSKCYASGPRAILSQLCTEMNRRVCERQKELYVSRMGTTCAMLMFVPDEVYACNLGDSRIYRLRDGEFLQLSTDDLERIPEGVKRKAGLTQFLGIPADELAIDPHIVKCELKSGDTFLICSDGLTDMLANLDICMILREHVSIKRIVRHLLEHALKNGGRDNISVIVIRID